MPSSYSASLRFTLQATGENTNTWGVILNQGAFQLIDSAISGRTTFSLSGNKTLITANGATDEARAAMLDITGGTGGIVTIPSVSKTYLVRSAATGAVTITTGAGAVVSVAPPAAGGAAYAVVLCNGTDVFRNPNQTEIDAALTAAKAYTDSVVTASGNLPGFAGNAGRFLQVNSSANGAQWVPLGGAASLNVGTASGTVAAGDDSRIVGAAQTSAVPAAARAAAFCINLVFGK